ncbi:S-methyl-5-thioribose kinase [Candidatus Methylacidithermus pantelleriae]|uniref:S-methyl-5-thioribose kinase n=1 Tax=Candidatus Methylacidithermus pantelleriae TaxID=2744239 RepID=A0A8J2BS74_9BACT|nr:S-methyl-5-thioribose kinase [Candidatus Methylacidithermus pantelleriae]CAF0695978.1 S-methyl-5-thioribose kinase [Candidatus Methylacidithermus pantelleriae]
MEPRKRPQAGKSPIRSFAESLTEQSAVLYVLDRPSLRDGPLRGARTLRAESLAEGNVNLIFRVGDPETGSSVILKQALPFAWRYPAFRMPRSRARIEYEWLQRQKIHSPQWVPRVFDFDRKNYVLAMEDLKDFTVLRKALITGQKPHHLGFQVGQFLARSLFYTTDFFLPSQVKKRLVCRFLNPVLRKVQEELVFLNPWTEHPTNRWTSALASEVQSLQKDGTLRAKVLHCLQKYSSCAEALIHNDFHTGSLLVSPTGLLKVVDAEFAFFGPIAHDLGTFFAHLALSYAAQVWWKKRTEEQIAYRKWIEEQLTFTWSAFEEDFLSLWEADGQPGRDLPRYRTLFLRTILRELPIFAAAEIVRRIIGLAHVEDLESIPELESKVSAERMALAIARAWIRESDGIRDAKDLTELMRQAASP